MWMEVDGGVVQEEVADPGSTEHHDRRENPRVEEAHGEPRDPFPMEEFVDVVVVDADTAWFPFAASSGPAALLQ